MVLWEGPMEDVVMMFSNAYNNRKVLLTGHTGFKGSWLALWLRNLGAEVIGLSLPAESSPNHWELLNLDMDCVEVDIRDEVAVRQQLHRVQPDVVFHLAAQSLVHRSYREPLNTWATNVMGTANVLDACRHAESVKGIVVVTTDKCYENKEWVWGYREIDPLGGYDPYSASKAGSELVTASYRRAFFGGPEAPLLASARAGNVIGGGDWSEDRLIPDLARCLVAGTQLEVRSPAATRPWQHVLDCLSGYLMLGERLLAGQHRCAEAWNFGPDRESNQPVAQVLAALQASWPAVNWRCADAAGPHEAQLLHLDSSKARQSLGWRPVWTFAESIAATAQWYRSWIASGEVISQSQLQQYIDTATERGVLWTSRNT